MPRLGLQIGRHRLPAWTTLGRTGALAGTLVFSLTCTAVEISASLTAMLIAASTGAFLLWREIGRRWRGGRYILLEFAVLTFCATAGVAAALDGPVGEVLDRWMVGLAVCLAIGRLGCLCHGCCHGQAALRGLRYPWLPPWYIGSRWEALRLFPLQAVEAGWLVTLAVTGAWLTILAPGLTVSLLPVGYAIGRFELERWRGDKRRYVGPLSHNQWWCIALTTAVAILGDRWIGAAGLVIILSLLAARARHLEPAIALSSPDELAALGSAVDRALAGEAARVGPIMIAPIPGGIQIHCGRSSLSHRAAHVIEAVVASRGHLSA